MPKTCTSCARKKIKCDKVIPCRPCIERGEAHLCAREVVLVKGMIRNVDIASDANVPVPFMNEMRRLETENAELLKQISSLQKLVVELRLHNRSSSESSPAHLPGLNGLQSPINSPESPALSPSAQSEATVNTYANALQYLTIGIIEEEETETSEVPRQRTKMTDNIPAFSRKPLDKKDNLPFCPSCSIGEMSHCFAARLPFDSTQHQKIFLSLAFEAPDITRKQSTMIVQYALECLNFLHCAVHPPSFYLEHDYYWDSDQPKKLSFEYDRNRGQYLWTAIWYAILCLGTFYADDDLKQRLGIEVNTLQVYAHMFFAASLESLHRGEVYKFPDIRSVQVFCILGPCYQAFSGINMRNSLLNTMVYISQRLNLDKIDSEAKLKLTQRNDYGDVDTSTRFLDRELGRRIWWSVVNSDWLDSTGRMSNIRPGSFTTVIPGNFNDSDLLEFLDKDEAYEVPVPYSPEVFTASTFHIYMTKLASIKRKYYFDNDAQLDCLLAANEELDRLSESLPPPLRNTSSKFVYGNYESQALSLQRYLIHIATDFERLTINRTMAVYLPKAKWNESCRQACLNYARSLLTNCSINVPLVFKKHPMVSGNGIAAAVYVLLDLLDDGLQPQITERLKWVDEFLPVLEQLQQFHSQARRGISIITKLTTGVLLKSEQHAKSKKGRRKRQHDSSEPAPSLYDIIQRLTILPRVSTAPPKSKSPEASTVSSQTAPSTSTDSPYPPIKIESDYSTDFTGYMLQPEFNQPAAQPAYGLPPQSGPDFYPQQQAAAFEQPFVTQAPFTKPQPYVMPGLPIVQQVDASAVTYEDLEIMCGLTNQDFDTSVVNFSTDFDFDMSILRQPPRDCPDDI